MSAAVIVQDSFLGSAYELPKDIAKKVFKALRLLVTHPESGGLHIEKLNGKLRDLWSARVDQDYRIIFEKSNSGTPIVLLVAKHDEAYDPRSQWFRGVACLHLGASMTLASALETVPVIGAVLPLVSGMREAHYPAEVTTDIDLLENLVTTRKYLPLARHLFSSGFNRVELGFEQIEDKIGESLPESARRYRPWWGNDRSNSQASAWLGVGWKLESVDMAGHRVTFARCEIQDH